MLPLLVVIAESDSVPCACSPAPSPVVLAALAALGASDVGKRMVRTGPSVPIRDPETPFRAQLYGPAPMARCGWKSIPFGSMHEMDFLIVTERFCPRCAGSMRSRASSSIFSTANTAVDPDFALTVRDGILSGVFVEVEDADRVLSGGCRGGGARGQPSARPMSGPPSAQATQGSLSTEGDAARIWPVIILGKETWPIAAMLFKKPLLNASRIRGSPCSRLRNTQKSAARPFDQ